MHFHQLDILLRRIASTEPPDFSGGMDENALDWTDTSPASTEPPDFSGGMDSLQGSHPRAPVASTEPPDFSGGMNETGCRCLQHERASTEPPDFSGGMVDFTVTGGSGLTLQRSRLISQAEWTISRRLSSRQRCFNGAA